MRNREVVLAVVFVVVITFLAGVGTVAAQSTQINETYSSAGDEEFSSVVQTQDGGYALAGKTGTIAGDSDAWLVKTDADGNVEFSKTHGGSGDDLAASVVQTSDGGYALAGDTESFGRENASAWLVKIDSNGNEEFNRTYGGNEIDEASSVVEISDGYALAGDTRSDSLTSSFEAAWLIETDETGNERFNRTYGGSEIDNAHSVTRTQDGGYALAGETNSYSQSPGLNPDGWLIKTSSDGTLQFNETYPGGDADVQSLVQTPGGGYALAGSTTSFGSGSNNNVWLIRTSGTGAEIYNRTYGGPEPDEARSVVQTSDGGYAITGFTESFGSNGKDGWLIKTDSSGNKGFEEFYGGSGSDSDVMRSVVQASDGGYAIAGGTASFDTDGNFLTDGWLIKATSPSGGNTPPTASFITDPVIPEVNETVEFNASGSADPDGTVEEYDWDFDDRTTLNTKNETVNHSYSSTGEYDVNLTVTDNESATGTTIQTISVVSQNQEPTASFTFTPSNPDVGETVSFDASNSSDTDGTIQSYAWEFGDGNTSSGENVTHSYSSTGVYDVNLTVTDDAGATDVAQETVTVASSIVGCADIDSSGTYTLGGDIVDAPQESCINITANNVVFDGQGHTVDGNGSGVGINVSGSSDLTNVTVKNVTATDWSVGVDYNNVDNGVITGVNASSNEQLGIRLEGSANNEVTESTATANDNSGISLFFSVGNKLSANNASENLGDGISVSSSSTNNELVGNDVINNGEDGVKFISGADLNTLTDGKVSKNRDGIVSASNNITVTGVNASGNSLGISNNGIGTEVLNSRINDNNRGVFSGTTGGIEIRNTTVSGSPPFSVANATIKNTTSISDGLFFPVFRAFGDAVTVENLDIGSSTAPNTTISGEFLEARLFTNSTPPADPSGENNISRYVEVLEDGSTPEPDRSYANITFEYDDSDVAGLNESSLNLWNLTDSPTELGGTVDETANEVSYNITDLGGVFAPLANTSDDAPFTEPLVDRFDDPPQNTKELHPTLYEDLNGDGDGKSVAQTVSVFGELIRGNDLGLTDDQARKFNWNSGSPETEVTVADMVTLFGKQIRAD